MIVEELISLIKPDIDPASLARFQNFTAIAEKGLYGLAAAVLAIPAAVAGASAGLVGIGTKMATDLEMTTAEITTMLGGNVQQAKALIGEVRQFANTTPFETMPLIDNAKTMMSMGIAAQDTLKFMKMIGDVAGGNQEKMSSFVYNFSQVKQIGKLQGQDLRQFATGGFNPLGSLVQDRNGNMFTKDQLLEKVKAGIMSMSTYEKVVGKTKEQLVEMSSAGEIGFQEMVDGFKMATSVGGLFYGNLDRMAKTVQGRWSTLTDAVKTNLIDIGNKFLPLVSRALDTIAKVVDYIGPIWVEVVDQMRVFFQSLGMFNDSTIEDFGTMLAIVLETLITTTADLIYTLTMLFYGAKAGFQGLGIFLMPLLKLLYNTLWQAMVWPLEAFLKLLEGAAAVAGLTKIKDGLHGITSAIAGMPNTILNGAAGFLGFDEDSLANNLMMAKQAAGMIGKAYNPRIAKPPKFEQNNTIHQEITIDPKADPTGKTSLHMKGLKEAVRSAFNIEVMQILGSARG